MAEREMPRCARCGRRVEFYRDEIGVHPKHVVPLALHFADPDTEQGDVNPSVGSELSDTL